MFSWRTLMKLQWLRFFRCRIRCLIGLCSFKGSALFLYLRYWFVRRWFPTFQNSFTAHIYSFDKLNMLLLLYHRKAELVSWFLQSYWKIIYVHMVSIQFLLGRFPCWLWWSWWWLSSLFNLRKWFFLQQRFLQEEEWTNQPIKFVL